MWDHHTIRSLRIFLGETQQVFARRIGVRQATVSAWESGQTAPRRVAQKVLTTVAEWNGYFKHKKE